jgi:hypothetical protein
MKTWFKYEYGYVNLDSDTLYLTNSGNWSETTTLSEKTKEITQKNDTKNYKYVSFLVSIIAFFCVLLFNTILSGKVSLTLFFLVSFGGYKVYNYLKTEIGPSFKIPLAKITDITIEDTTVELLFLNNENTIEFHKLKKVDQTGIDVLKSITPGPQN